MTAAISVTAEELGCQALVEGLIRIRSRRENLSPDDKILWFSPSPLNPKPALAASQPAEEHSHDPGFQVRFPSADQGAGIHRGGSVDACVSHWRELGDFRADQRGRAAFAYPVAAK